MKKKWLVLIAVMMIGLMMVVSSPVMAGPPETAEGFFYHMPELVDIRFAGRNAFMEITDVATWTGTFEGTSTMQAVVSLYGPEDTDPALVKGIFEFEGEVQGKTGTLQILLRAWWHPEVEWHGYWKIIGGTGELANLRGQGTTSGLDPGFGNVAENEYSGKIHFEP
ncbi:MAG TPA: DUF3224 domain-containing protein [Anaerolineales bacterium]|nr:DUF3224 domain-containing protein [Anaerolineales bacterium]